jgi:hypothetical protein
MKKLFFLCIATQMLLSCSNYGDKLEFNATEVYYKDGVTEAEATQLGNYLVTSEFADGTTKSVQFVRNKESQNLTFRMVMLEEAAKDATNDVMFKLFARELSNEFKQPVDFEACDNTFKTLKTFYYKDLQKVVKAKATDVMYSATVPDEIAQKTADFLVEYGYSDDRAKTVSIEKTDTGYQFKAVVKEGAEKDNANVVVFKLLRDIMKDSVFGGKPLEMHLCNDKLETLKILD